MQNHFFTKSPAVSIRGHTLYGSGHTALKTIEPSSKLDAQPTSERPERRDYRRSSVRRVQGDVPLSQNIVAIRDRLPPAQAESRQGLPNPDMEVWIHPVLRRAVAIDRRNRAPTYPVVPGHDFSSRARQFRGYRSADRVMHGGLQHVAQGALGQIFRRQRSGVRVDRRNRYIVREVFADRDA